MHFEEDGQWVPIRVLVPCGGLGGELVFSARRLDTGRLVRLFRDGTWQEID